MAKLEKALASAERQLGNESFLSKAPPNVVEGLRKQESENRLLMGKTRKALEELGHSQTGAKAQLFSGGFTAGLKSCPDTEVPGYVLEREAARA